MNVTLSFNNKNKRNDAVIQITNLYELPMAIYEAEAYPIVITAEEKQGGDSVTLANKSLVELIKHREGVLVQVLPPISSVVASLFRDGMIEFTKLTAFGDWVISLTHLGAILVSFTLGEVRVVYSDRRYSFAAMTREVSRLLPEIDYPSDEEEEELE